MKRVVAVFDVNDYAGEAWHQQDIALRIDTCTVHDDFKNATVGEVFGG